jgi:hypothetical protein
VVGDILGGLKPERAFLEECSQGTIRGETGAVPVEFLTRG